MIDVRVVEESEMMDYVLAYRTVFGGDPEPDDEGLRRFLLLNDPGLCIAAFDDGRIVGTAGSYRLDVTVPGGAALPMLGLTHVTVNPTHRRQGLLTQMMAMQLAQAQAEGVACSGLWASEETIYGRFGYGPATWMTEVTVDAGAVNWPVPAGDVKVRPVPVAEATDLLPAIYDDVRGLIAGWIPRSTDWWNERFLMSHNWAGGKPRRPYRCVVAERDGKPVGYLMYRVTERVPESDEGTTEVEELVAADDDARRALWQVATHVDLYRHVTWWGAPTDDPLFVEVDRGRRLQVKYEDALWLRVLDVPAALESRSYLDDGNVGIRVVDDTSAIDGPGPADGVFQLEARDGIGRVTTGGQADVELSVAVLGRLLLGGASARSLARAGLLTGADRAVATLDGLMAAERAPHCPEVF